MNGIKALVSEYGQISDKNVILYIHGGGFISGSALASKGYSSMLAKYSGCRVIAVNYSLAPEHKVDDFTVKEGCLKPLNQIYVADNPYISPLFGDFSGFPPTYITCDYNETLYADAKALYEKCEQSKVDVELVEVKGTFHAFATIGTGTPETKQILEENVAFMKKYI